MAARDNNPGTKQPTGPSAQQPATNPQKQFVQDLGATDQLSQNATKGEASDVIAANLNNSSGQSNAGSGAAQDTTPGSTVPTGPSAKQDATRNQKAFIERLGEGDSIQPGLTKGEASDIISEAKSSGATNSSGGVSTGRSNGNSGAAPDNNPGNTIPSGPSRDQPATTNQKDLLSSLGASKDLPSGATKGDASDLISKHLNQ